MTTKTTSTAIPASVTGEGIPDFLRAPKPATAPVEVKSQDAPPVAKAKAAAKAKPTPEAKARTVKRMAAETMAKAKPAPKAKQAKPATKAKPHQPSTVAPTEANPAKSIVPVRFKKEYAAHNDTCGRPLSLALKTATTTRNADGREVLDTKALAAIAKEHGIDFAAYKHLNNGQQRMNVGNRLMGMVKQGKTVTIGGRKFANADKALAAPKAQAVA